MSDIVERLRSGWNRDRNPEIDMCEAADTIDSLRQRVAELEGAPDVLVQNAALTGENMTLRQRVAELQHDLNAEKAHHAAWEAAAHYSMEKLAACEKERHDFEERGKAIITRLHERLAASEQRVAAQKELLKEMGEALEEFPDHGEYFMEHMDATDMKKSALAKYKEWMK